MNTAYINKTGGVLSIVPDVVTGLMLLLFITGLAVTVVVGIVVVVKGLLSMVIAGLVVTVVVGMIVVVDASFSILSVCLFTW